MKKALVPMIAAVTVLTAAGVAFATDDVTSLSYISYLERYGTVRPAQDDQPLEAVVNMPVLSGDRIETSRGSRLEIQLADGCTLWLDELSVLDVDAVVGSRDDPSPRTTVFLAQGGLALEVPETSLGEQSVRVDTGFGATLLDRPGLYRVELERDGVRVEAHAGLAELPAGVGSVLLRAGQQALVDGQGSVEKYALRAGFDDFWAWVEARRRTVGSGASSEYVDGVVAGRARVLDGYGEWVYLTSYSTWTWRPRVAAGWVPYSYGRWYWTPVGWSWISYEPWGWLPYHYGTWHWDVGFGWVWSWDPIWAPAWVHWLHYPGYVGWCPRGYYDWWYYDHCTGCRDRHRHDPHRWRDAALDFSGRVRVRDVDPRPWTFVRSDGFTSSRLDRLRVDPSRLLRDLPGDSFGHVRSGPLVTPRGGRDGAGRSVEAALRGTIGERELPDLTTMLRRDAAAAPRLGELPVRQVRTAEIQTPSRRTPSTVDTGTPGTRSVPPVGRTDSGAGTGVGTGRPRTLPGTVESDTGGVPRPTVRQRPDAPTESGTPAPATPRRGTGQPGATPGRTAPPRTVHTQPATPSKPTVQRNTPSRRDADPSPPATSKPRVEVPAKPADPPPTTVSMRRAPSGAVAHRVSSSRDPVRPAAREIAPSSRPAPTGVRSRSTPIAPVAVGSHPSGRIPVTSGARPSAVSSPRQPAHGSAAPSRAGSVPRTASPAPAPRDGSSSATTSSRPARERRHD